MHKIHTFIISISVLCRSISLLTIEMRRCFFPRKIQSIHIPCQTTINNPYNKIKCSIFIYSFTFFLKKKIYFHLLSFFDHKFYFICRQNFNDFILSKISFIFALIDKIQDHFYWTYHLQATKFTDRIKPTFHC